MSFYQLCPTCLVLDYGLLQGSLNYSIVYLEVVLIIGITNILSGAYQAMVQVLHMY